MGVIAAQLISVEGFEKVWQYADLFKQGIICTILLSALTVIIGFAFALLLALMRMSNSPFGFLARIDVKGRRTKNFLIKLSHFNPISLVANVYVEIFRATPMLVQLFIIYQVVFSKSGIDLPSITIFGFIKLNRFLPGVVALAMNSGAYLSEIIRAGVQSIDGGQTEAARSLGLSQLQNMRYIVLPQAIKNILPAIANEFVTIIKESAICYTIGVQDLMFSVKAAQSATFRIAEPLLIAAAMYFCLTFPTSKIIAHFERRMSRGDKR